MSWRSGLVRTVLGAKIVTFKVFVIDATKYTTTLKRPVAQRAQDIGVWLTIIQTLTYVSVLTNGLVIAMTSDFIPKLVYQYGFSTNSSLEGFREWTLTSKCLCFYNQILCILSYNNKNIFRTKLF